MVTKREVEVEVPNELETRLKCARDIVGIFVDYILQGGVLLDNNSSAFAERTIALYRGVQVALNAAQSLREQLVDLSWSLVTRLRNNPTDKHHALRERLANEKGHPVLHDGTEGELLFFTLRYIHLAIKARQTSLVGDSWPDDIDELAKNLLAALRAGPNFDPELMARDVLHAFGEGIPSVDPIGHDQGVHPQQIDGVAKGRALWLGIDESDEIGT
jgi:hypothetical protein